MNPALTEIDWQQQITMLKQMTVILKEFWVIWPFCSLNNGPLNRQELSQKEYVPFFKSWTAHFWIHLKEKCIKSCFLIQPLQDLLPLLSVRPTGESVVTSYRALINPELTACPSVISPLISSDPEKTHFQLNKQIKLWPPPRAERVAFMTRCVYNSNPKKHVCSC